MADQAVDATKIIGVLLAAGGGSRMGMPKALVVADGVPWLRSAVELLQAAGCADVLITLGARADEARALLPADDRLRVVEVPDWAVGMSVSLRAALVAAAGTTARAALITLVDLPGLPVEVARRVITDGSAADPATSLARATFDGRPGHPVLIGRDHWPVIIPGLAGDRGAGPYLKAHDATLVECGDLATGEDRDSR